MLSVRVAAAGMVVASLSFVAAPAGACDFDRYQKKCDREIAARAEAESASERKSAKRMRAGSSRRARHTRQVKRSKAPRFAIKREAPQESGMTLASSSARMTTLVPESVLARRFRGFIDPRPVADNSFEPLRKPHVVALNFDAHAIAGPTATVEATAAPELPAATVTPKQDKARGMELAAAESKPVTLPPAPPAPAATQQAAAAPAAPPPLVTAEASLAAAPAEAPGGFSIHGLVLALCGALGAASALRFIVGA